MIQVTNLTKVYPSGCKAIDDLSLSIDQGEIFALLGPNGAGKTSTIRVLSTLAGFDTGTVTVAGHNVDTAPAEVRGAIGFVGQQTGVDNFLTGRENLVLQGQLYRITHNELRARIDELSSYFNLEDSLDTLVMTYSGGMRRKLDIASSLIHKPRVLFLDEPTLGLDINSRQVLWQLIKKLNEEFKLTILLTTHYLEEADRLAHRVGIINTGKIQVIGTPEELKDKISGDAVVLVFEAVDDAVNAFFAAMQKQPYVRNAVWDQDKLHLYVDNAPGNVAGIMQAASEHGARVKTLSLSRPSLDDVFIKYTGTSLESEGGESAEPWWAQWAGKGSWGQSKNWEKWAGKEEQTDGGGPQGEDGGGHWRQWTGHGGEKESTEKTPETRPHEKWDGGPKDGGGEHWRQWTDHAGEGESSEKTSETWPDKKWGGGGPWDKDKQG